MSKTSKAERKNYTHLMLNVKFDYRALIRSHLLVKEGQLLLLCVLLSTNNVVNLEGISRENFSKNGKVKFFAPREM